MKVGKSFFLSNSLFYLQTKYLLKGSSIIIISSLGGYELEPLPIGFYSITKTALLALVKIL